MSRGRRDGTGRGVEALAGHSPGRRRAVSRLLAMAVSGTSLAAPLGEAHAQAGGQADRHDVASPPSCRDGAAPIEAGTGSESGPPQGAATASGATRPTTAPAVPPAHLVLARELLASLDPSRTAYRHRSAVHFARDGAPAIALTDCSGLVNALLERTHPAAHDALRAASRRGRPQAVDYLTAISRGDRFEPVTRLDAVLPGDLIAIGYPPGADDTGHLMIVDARPEPLDAAAGIDGLAAWAIAVIDATRSPHGPGDDRAGPPPRTGVGRGVVRLFADPCGAPAGYAWSRSPRSPLHRVADRPIAIGRPR